MGKDTARKVAKNTSVISTAVAVDGIIADAIIIVGIVAFSGLLSLPLSPKTLMVNSGFLLFTSLGCNAPGFTHGDIK